MSTKDQKTHIETTSVGGVDSELQSEKNTRAVDDALGFAAEAENITWTEEEEKRVVRKIDLVILSMLFVGAAVGYADQQAFGYAALFGMVEDMKLYTVTIVKGLPSISLSKYSFAAAIPALGAVAGQYPLLAIAQYFSYGKFVGITAIFTGVLALLTTVCTDNAQILALRFFFGFASIVSPLAVIITAMWWKTDEQPLRVGSYIAGSATGNLIGQAVDIGAVSIMGGAYEKSPWKWIYLILGSIAVLYGLIALVLFPASPMKAWFLTDREKHIAVRRLAANQTGIQTRKFKWGQLIEAFLDPQMYLLGIYLFSFSFVNGALGSFGAFLVSSFGYSDKQAITLSMPISAMAIVCMLLSGFLGTKFPRHRVIIAMAFILPSIAGNAILWKSDRSNLHALLGGLYISATFFGAFIQCFALIAANIAGHTKKTVVNASIIVLSSLGGFAGPWAYHQEQAKEGYPTGQISALSLLCASLASFACLGFYYRAQNNKKIAQRQAQHALVSDPNLAFMDLTDQENPLFHYAS